MHAAETIALFTVWLGEWKGWINLHLKSCAHNPSITWFFLHDQSELPTCRPPNVHFIRTSLTEIAARCSRHCGLTVNLKNPYKICDVRPLLGSLFPEVLEGYSWWGYCDNDLIWGRIREFLTDDVLKEYDVISSHVCSTIGQCTVFRGVHLAYDLIKEISGINQLLADPEYKGIDELTINKAALVRERHGTIKVCRRMLQVWERLYEPSWEDWASSLETERQGQPVKVKFLTGPCEWKEGKVTHVASQTETMFFHFMEWKRGWKMPLYPAFSNLESILIDSNGFHLVFKKNNLMENARVRITYDLPYRVQFPIQAAWRKIGRGWRKILRAFQTT